MAVYGFVASILPVSILLLPRDYLSSFLKIGTVALLVIGVILGAAGVAGAPAINTAFLAGGPIAKRSIFPFVFTTGSCGGAISGLHASVEFGDDAEDAGQGYRMRVPIGYGAMLLEGFGGDRGVDCRDESAERAVLCDEHAVGGCLPKYQRDIAELAKADLPPPGEPRCAAAGGGGVECGRESAWPGLAGACDAGGGHGGRFLMMRAENSGATSSGVAWMEGMMKYWYHFAIMFRRRC